MIFELHDRLASRLDRAEGDQWEAENEPPVAGQAYPLQAANPTLSDRPRKLRARLGWCYVRALIAVSLESEAFAALAEQKCSGPNQIS
jgi:hypothetical protein